MLATAFVTIPLSVSQLAACIAVLFATVALTWLLGVDEGFSRGRVEGRRLAQEAREKARKQLRESAWFPARRHR